MWLTLLDTEVLDLAFPKKTDWGGGCCLTASQEPSWARNCWQEAGGLWEAHQAVAHLPRSPPSSPWQLMDLWSCGPDWTPTPKPEGIPACGESWECPTGSGLRSLGCPSGSSLVSWSGGLPPTVCHCHRRLICWVLFLILLLTFGEWFPIHWKD